MDKIIKNVGEVTKESSEAIANALKSVSESLNIIAGNWALLTDEINN